MQDKDICPVRALRHLLASRNFEPHQPLFAENVSPCTQVIDTKIDALRKIRSLLNIPIKGHTFHAFRRSGAIVAFGQYVNLADTKTFSLLCDVQRFHVFTSQYFSCILGSPLPGHFPHAEQ